MIAAAVVTVLIDGVPIEGSQPAQLRGGSVIAPVSPYAQALAERIELDPAYGTLVIRRGDRSIDVPLVAAPGGEPVVALGVVARKLGADVDFDARSKTLRIVLVPAPLSSLVPDVGYTPPAQVRAAFTPNPTPAPKIVVTGAPQPRRTPIPIEGDNL